MQPDERTEEHRRLREGGIRVQTRRHRWWCTRCDTEWSASSAEERKLEQHQRPAEQGGWRVWKVYLLNPRVLEEASRLARGGACPLGAAVSQQVLVCSGDELVRGVAVAQFAEAHAHRLLALGAVQVYAELLKAPAGLVGRDRQHA